MSSSTPGDFEIPAKMQRLVVTSPGESVADCQISTQTVSVLQPQAGQVLVKVVAAAVNPSDYGSWIQARPEQCPYAMGKEGCGIVVKMGGGFSLASAMQSIKVGTHVGFAGLKNKQGSYSEYVVCNATEIFSLPTELAIEDAASFFVNPYTAIGILDTIAKKTSAGGGGSKAFVHTAAASQLGQMMVKLAPSEGIQIINVVRRQSQAELLQDLGAEHIVVTEEENWKDNLKSQIKECGATVAMDAVAGSMTGDLLEMLPNKGTVYVYGGLAGKASNVDPMDLIYREKQIKGFFLTSWIGSGGVLSTIPRMLAASKKVNDGLLAEDGWSRSQFQDTTLETLQWDLVTLLENKATGKKLRLRFDKKPEEKSEGS